MLVSSLDFGSVLYLCDGKACGDECPNELCHHTNQWEHALHKDTDLKDFIARPSRVEGKVDLWEPNDD